MLPTPSPFVATLAALDRVLAALGVRWYLFGAQAALLYGAARLTADVDITVQLRTVSSRALADALELHGFDLRVSDDAFVERTRVMPVVHRETSVPVDIVLGGPGLEDLFLDRAQHHDFEGIRIPVASPEDLIVMKLLAGRPKDIDDVRALLNANSDTLRLELVRETLAQLEAALDQSDLSPLLEALLRQKA